LKLYKSLVRPDPKYVYYVSAWSLHYSKDKVTIESTARVVDFFADFLPRVINVWNCLPPYVDYSTLATFRRSIDGIHFTSSLKCDID